jgi:hypothetical protein
MDEEGLKKHGVMEEEQPPGTTNPIICQPTRAEGDQASGIVVQIPPSHAEGTPR